MNAKILFPLSGGVIGTGVYSAFGGVGIVGGFGGIGLGMASMTTVGTVMGSACYGGITGIQRWRLWELVLLVV
jgi:hypothetical protein